MADEAHLGILAGEPDQPGPGVGWAAPLEGKPTIIQKSQMVMKYRVGELARQITE